MEALYPALASTQTATRGARLRSIILQALYLVLSIAILAVSLILLIKTLPSDLPAPALTMAVLWEGIGFVIGFYSFVHNARAALLGKVGGIFIGLDERLDHPTPRELALLSKRADEAYDIRAGEYEAYISSPIGRWRTLREITLAVMLAGIVAIISYLLPHSSAWQVVAWALLGFFTPYVIAVLYQFFCSTLDRYAFRRGYVLALQKTALPDQPPRSAGAQPAPHTNPLSNLRGLWARWTIEFPVITAFISLILGNGLCVAIGLVASQAILPFLDLRLASTSLLDFVLQGSALFGWNLGFEHVMNLQSFVIQWHLPHTLGAIVTIAIVSYVLVYASGPKLLRRYGTRSLPFILLSIILSPFAWICLIVYPIVWLVSLGFLRNSHLNVIITTALSRFWMGMLQLWIIYSAFAVLLVLGGEWLARIS